jgi:plastocyanin
MRARLMFLPLAAAILACGGSSDSTGPVNTGGGGGGGGVSTNAVDIQNRTFSPSVIKVAPGTSVTWSNQSNEAHNVTFANGVSGSGGTIGAGGTAALVMPTAAGTYNYTCTFHAGMSGSVQVQ